MKRNLIVIGLGPHAQLAQYRFLNLWHQSGHPVRVRLLVELQDRAENVEQYLAKTSLQPDQLFGLPESDRNDPAIHPQLLAQLNRLKPTVDGMLVCTEPKAHKKYILWALENNIDVLVDKPLTASILTQTGPEQIWQDYLDIEQALAHSSAHLSLMTNKRLHPAYEAVYKQTEAFVKQYQLPITQIEISEGGGVWPFPREFQTRENHPFKYGYGVLLHTGFHYIDLLMHYQSINHQIGLQEDNTHVHAFGTTPYDVLHQITQPVYEKLFPKADFAEQFAQAPQDAYKQYGMPDIMSTMQFLKEGAVITQASLNMLQNTLSSRYWWPHDYQPGKGLGRLAQTHISLFCGPLFHIRLGFYQPDELPKGQYDHYVVETTRNTALVGGKSYECLDIEDKGIFAGEAMSINRVAKFNLMARWMEQGVCPETEFSLHKRSVWLTMKIAEELAARRKERFAH